MQHFILIFAILTQNFLLLLDQTKWQLSQKLGNPYTELPVLDDVIKRVLETGIS